MTKECPFCNRELIKSKISFVDDCMVFEPLNPVTKGHLLVVPVRHVDDFTSNMEVTASVMETAARIARDKGGSFNLITSKGIEATQTVFHMHVHLVPRREKDNLSLPWFNPHQ